ncbi:MAG: ABC transporter permease [bacterium]
MTWLRLAFANLLLSPPTTAVNVLLMSLGTASIVVILLAGEQLADTVSRDAKGIDLVLGAQGSPVQLVLSAVYHADVPPGNIKLSVAQKWADDPRIATAIPLSLGDSFRGFRIVGTTDQYVELYGAVPVSGRIWDKPMEAVLGAAVASATGLDAGSTFAGAHGLVEGGHEHNADLYRVVGVLAPTGTVLDRLVLTSLESVWALHDEHSHAHEADDSHDAHPADAEHVYDEDHHHEYEHETENEHTHHHEHGAHPDIQTHQESTQQGREHRIETEALAPSAEITAMLLSYRSPLAAMSLPREINADGTLQAAAPAMEISRILQLVGLGMAALVGFASILVATAALSIFAALYGSLRARRGELAMLRCLGAIRLELLFYLMIEGFLLSVMGVSLGFLVGHGMMELIGSWLSNATGVVMTGWTWAPAETPLLFGLLIVGLSSAIIPAVQAYRTNVVKTLVEG